MREPFTSLSSPQKRSERTSDLSVRSMGDRPRRRRRGSCPAPSPTAGGNHGPIVGAQMAPRICVSRSTEISVRIAIFRMRDRRQPRFPIRGMGRDVRVVSNRVGKCAGARDRERRGQCNCCKLHDCLLVVEIRDNAATTSKTFVSCRCGRRCHSVSSGADRAALSGCNLESDFQADRGSSYFTSINGCVNRHRIPVL